MKNHIAIRMCIICRKRQEQNKLQRYFLNQGIPQKKLKTGRAAYLCELCLNTDQKKLQAAFKRAFKGRKKISGKS